MRLNPILTAIGMADSIGPLIAFRTCGLQFLWPGSLGSISDLAILRSGLK